MLHMVPYSMSHQSWKFHENPFLQFPVLLVTHIETGRQRDKQTNKD